MSRLEGAAERVAAFLQERTKLTAIDPEVIYKVNHEELLTDDLLALVEAAHFMRVMLGINASARVQYATTTEDQGTATIVRDMPLSKARLDVKRWNELRESGARGTDAMGRAFVVQRIVTDWEESS
ncbi:hypothetical protein SEA_GREKAYCON_63 [Arthrobacter phage Grekaycon]|uniref:Uncharacterized protein n=1 Tax=Arthrobacter phage Grekaycon TaxID=2591068 RepID=A0A514A5M7_9CAUD|nr:hypothetical protein SEA_GREKAYCON_63 [Arthrobacter phage Grekaycon]